MLSKGQVNFETEKLTDDQRAILKLRELGYSRVKTIKLLKMGRKQLNSLKTNYTNTGRHERFFKSKEELELRISRALIDLGLYHEIDVENIKQMLDGQLEIVNYGQNRPVKNVISNKKREQIIEAIKQKKKVKTITKELKTTASTIAKIRREMT